jgi:hypothetical protein
MTHPTTGTVPTTIRITPTQHSELRKHNVSQSVIIRVLLKLWLDGRIDIDNEIAEEKQRTEQAIINRG